MAFFGLTHLGYQNPIGDKSIVNPRGASLSRGEMTVAIQLQRKQPLARSELATIYVFTYCQCLQALKYSKPHLALTLPSSKIVQMFGDVMFAMS